MPHFGVWELLIIFLIVFLLFGAGRVATLGSALGRSIRDFRREVNDLDSSIPTEPQPPSD